ncbi:Pao retrotransposon peptidase, partial [Oesophagostomum dentatum]
MAEIDEIKLSVTDLLQNLRDQIQSAMNFIGARKDQTEREKMMNDLDSFLSNEANSVEIKTVRWTSRLKYRQKELENQSGLIRMQPSTSTAASVNDDDVNSRALSRTSVESRLRLPQLEVPAFHGSYREYPTFWTTYNTLIHSNHQLSNTDKFLFLKQALKGSAAALLSTMPVIGENYEKAIKLLDKRFNKSGCIADLLITELERLPPAQTDAASCRRTLETITEKLTHIECSGVPLDNSRMWRRLILSKFPDTISERVLRKEHKGGRHLSTDEIMEILENSIAMKETIAITTDAIHDRLNFKQFRPARYQETHVAQPKENREVLVTQRNKPRTQCICGSSSHGAWHCPTFTTPEARRNEATKRKLCWKCFNNNHRSNDCSSVKPCPRCGRDHHSALCYTDSSTGNSVFPHHNGLHLRTPYQGQAARRQGTSQNAELVCPTSNNTAEATEEQYVLMTATALAFNMDSMDYEPITIFFDTGAQKSFINTEKSTSLQLPSTRNTSFTVSGFGGQIENFVSDEVALTLKNPTSGKVMKGIMMHTKSPLTSAMCTAKLNLADRKFIKKQKIKVAQPTLDDKIVTPDILLGQDLIDKFLLRDQSCVTLPSGLVLTPTVFGFAISGKSSVHCARTGQIHTENSAVLVATPVLSHVQEEYKEDIKNLYELESLGIKMEKDGDDESILRFMSRYRKSIKIENGKITAGFPFMDNVAHLKDNFNVAVKRLQALSRVLQQDPEKMRLYADVLQDYSSQGIIEEIQEQQNTLYVDNVILDGKSPDDLCRKYRESKKVFSDVGMNLRDYLSNCSTVNECIPVQDRAPSTAAKVLGIQWNSNNDQIALQCAIRMHTKTTKRAVLSQINGLCFDPLGLITPLLTKAKIFLQDLHIKKLGWDDALTQEDCQEWNIIRKEMTNFAVSLPRRVTQQQGCNSRTLSVFVDSSKRVYACAAYITTETDDGLRYSHLYCAKSKVAPVGTTQTIPKLELLAIFIGMNMMEYITSKSGLKIDRINLFSDSTIALSWIHSKKRLPTLVTTLTQKIQLSRERISHGHQVNFYHVPTAENVADYATRGLTQGDPRKSLWFEGPAWLNCDHLTWPVRLIDRLSQEEEDECFAVFSAMQETSYTH